MSLNLSPAVRNPDSIRRKNTYFVDLFVRVSNKVAINMYTNLGYVIYRTIIDYYSGEKEEDAYGKLKQLQILLYCPLRLYSPFPDMRKAMTRDKDKKSMIPLKHPVRSEDEF